MFGMVSGEWTIIVIFTLTSFRKSKIAETTTLFQKIFIFIGYYQITDRFTLIYVFFYKLFLTFPKKLKIFIKKGCLLKSFIKKKLFLIIDT